MGGAQLRRACEEGSFFYMLRPKRRVQIVGPGLLFVTREEKARVRPIMTRSQILIFRVIPFQMDESPVLACVIDKAKVSFFCTFRPTDRAHILGARILFV